MNSQKTVLPISVVVPCYRSRETIGVALASILGQTQMPAEILLVDDASGDGSLDFLRALEHQYAPLVKVIAQARNGGPGLARNAGWEAATQAWIAFLDADDAWHPRKLELQWAWLLAHPDADVCGHASRFTTGAIDEVIDAAPVAEKLSTRAMLVSNRLPTRSVMLRRNLPQRFQGKAVTEDYLLWLEIIVSGASAYRLDTCLAYALRPDFSPGGYSGQLWTHEKRELAALRSLRQNDKLDLPVFACAVAWSYLKYLRRVWLMRGAT